MLRNQEAAWNRGDLESFMSLGYERSETLTFFSGGSVSRGYEAMLERYRKRYQFGDAEMGRLKFAQLEFVDLGDDFTLARGRWDLDFEVTKDVGGLFSLILRRTTDGWRVMHDHTSVDG